MSGVQPRAGYSGASTWVGSSGDESDCREGGDDGGRPSDNNSSSRSPEAIGSTCQTHSLQVQGAPIPKNKPPLGSATAGEKLATGPSGLSGHEKLRAL